MRKGGCALRFGAVQICCEGLCWYVGVAVLLSLGDGGGH
jgi:hypothetical protein